MDNKRERAVKNIIIPTVVNVRKDYPVHNLLSTHYSLRMERQEERQ